MSDRRIIEYEDLLHPGTLVRLYYKGSVLQNMTEMVKLDAPGTDWVVRRTNSNSYQRRRVADNARRKHEAEVYGDQTPPKKKEMPLDAAEIMKAFEAAGSPPPTPEVAA
jgi:hypothetical protein